MTWKTLSPALAALLVGRRIPLAVRRHRSRLLASAALDRIGDAAAQVIRAAQSVVSEGIRIYLKRPRLRRLLALNLAVAAAGAMVLVDTVVLVRGALGHTDTDVAIAMAAFGCGSMVAALLLPRVLDRLGDRP